ncbi:hypothetical protein B0T13DRAFT_37876 [Neurospora crassa]|nr:hypothetical protein B0T13DRAFT_37876 [Neurospora crassa]
MLWSFFRVIVFSLFLSTVSTGFQPPGSYFLNLSEKHQQKGDEGGAENATTQPIRISMHTVVLQWSPQLNLNVIPKRMNATPLSHQRHLLPLLHLKMSPFGSSETKIMFSKLFGSCFRKRNGRKPAKSSATPSEDATETDRSHSRSQSHSRYPQTADNVPGSLQLQDLPSTKTVLPTSNGELGPRIDPKGISTSPLENAPELESVMA